ncbi:MAG: hypothetical protein ACFFD4_34065 [Candidatus Odinarchaeota archaeon]
MMINWVKSLRNLEADWLHKINFISNLLTVPKAPRDLVPPSGILEFNITDPEKSDSTKRLTISKQWIGEYLLLGTSLGYFSKEEGRYWWKKGKHVVINRETLQPRVMKIKQCLEIINELKNYSKPVPRKIIIYTVSQTDYDPHATKNKYHGYDPDSLQTAIQLLEAAGFIKQFKDVDELLSEGTKRGKKLVFLELLAVKHDWKPTDSEGHSYQCENCGKTTSIHDPIYSDVIDSHCSFKS